MHSVYVTSKLNFYANVRRFLWLCGVAALLPLTPIAARAACFTNSLRQGQDPAVIFKDGQFHLAQSAGGGIHLRRSATIAGLATASSPTIYTPPSSEGTELWAPEIHWLSNRWYLYYTLNTNSASNGRARRGFVAESQDSNATGPYTARGPIFRDYWNIDGSVFPWNGQLYYIFSGEPVQGAQCIYIARMSNPYTLATTPTQISAPVEPWETIGTPNVNEGPWGFERGGQLFISYSASGCWTDDYTLGLLILDQCRPALRRWLDEIRPGVHQESGRLRSRAQLRRPGRRRPVVEPLPRQPGNRPGLRRRPPHSRPTRLLEKQRHARLRLSHA